MDPKMNKRYDIASIGTIYRKSLEMFATHLEDSDGNTIGLDDIEVQQYFNVVFTSGNGLTRTSGVRIL